MALVGWVGLGAILPLPGFRDFSFAAQQQLGLDKEGRGFWRKSGAVGGACGPPVPPADSLLWADRPSVARVGSRGSSREAGSRRRLTEPDGGGSSAVLFSTRPCSSTCFRANLAAGAVDGMESVQELANGSTAEIPNDPGKMFVGGLSWQTTPGEWTSACLRTVINSPLSALLGWM
ncbi:unnamed protein product [Notodromas monacha]|uniref:Uncharacterized protein n=1 Tax=Notodromas monacha TaxID=399045 RepID=A0A7R9G913_9CRUS|nr:unnamed protein product [Notodromas monacha]CAG0912663.1 unnamed protein product [Notodromas monacha]